MQPAGADLNGGSPVDMAVFGRDKLGTAPAKIHHARHRREVQNLARAQKKSDFTGRRLRPATINRELACLKILFNRFEDTVPKNPVRKMGEPSTASSYPNKGVSLRSNPSAFQTSSLKETNLH